MKENYPNEQQYSDKYLAKDQQIHIPIEEVILEGNLTIPKNAKGVVIFAHGSGSSRYSPRNRFVSTILNEEGLATLLIDLLSTKEEAIDLDTKKLRFNITMLAERLVAITDWAMEDPQIKGLNIGYFGSSTGGGAAILAAIKTAVIKAIVSRGGRPDLAGKESLAQIKAPTLLIVGERDTQVLALNRQSLKYLNKKSALEIIPNATHLFEEAGTLEDVADLASSWFTKHLE